MVTNHKVIINMIKAHAESDMNCLNRNAMHLKNSIGEPDLDLISQCATKIKFNADKL